MKRMLVATLMVFTFVLPVAPLRAEESPSDLLALAPGDAWAVVCVRNLGELDKKLNTLIQQLNLPVPFQSPLTMGLSMLGFMSGVDANGGLGVVVLPGPSLQRLQDQSVLLIPTKDPKELLSLLEPQEVEPGISKIKIQNQELFVVHRGGHVVLGPTVDVLKAVLNSPTPVRAKLNPYPTKHYEKDDLFLWINAEAVLRSEPFKVVAPLLKTLHVDATAFAELRTVALTLRLSPPGLGVGVYLDAIPDTAAYKSACSQKGTTGSLLVGLPKERYVFGYGGASSKEAGEIQAEVLAKLLEGPQVQALQLGPAKLGEAKDILMGIVKAWRSLSVGASGLPEGPDGLVSLVKVVGVDGDAGQILTSAAQLVGLVKGGLIPNPQAAPILAAVEYSPAAETIDGVSVDHLVFDLTKAAGENAPKAQEWVSLVSKILGKEGMLIRVGAVDANHILVTLGGGPARFQAAADLVKEKQTPLADDGGIQRCRAQLPSSRSAEAYLAVDQLLTVISAVGKAMDEPALPLSLGELNSPIGFALEPVEKGGAQIEVFVPMELVIAGKNLVMNPVPRPDRPPGPGGTPVPPPPPPPPDQPTEKPKTDPK